MTKQEVIELYKKAAVSAMTEAKQNNKWDKNTPKAQAEVIAARRLSKFN